jgi:hypothetical protein
VPVRSVGIASKLPRRAIVRRRIVTRQPSRGDRNGNNRAQAVRSECALGRVVSMRRQPGLCPDQHRRSYANSADTESLHLACQIPDSRRACSESFRPSGPAPHRVIPSGGEESPGRCHSERSAAGARVPADRGQMRNRTRPDRGPCPSTGRMAIPRLRGLTPAPARNDIALGLPRGAAEPTAVVAGPRAVRVATHRI